MIQEIVNKVITGNKFLSIEILLKENNTQYHAIEVFRKKNNLSINSSATYGNFEDLLKHVPKNLPTFLSFTGQGIISKKVENTENYRSKLLFNANSEDFYWYELSQPKYIYASVARKSVIDNECNHFKENQIFIMGVSIGPLIISVLKPLLNDNVIYTNNYKLDYVNNELNAFEKNAAEEGTPEFYEIDGEKIILSDSVSFANVLNYLFPNESIDFDIDAIEKNKEEFKYRKAFNLLGAVALPGFLIALLISYFLLTNYQEQYIDLQVDLEEKNISYNKLILLKKDKDNKEAILNESGLNDSNFLSYYLSEITTDIPSELNLAELAVFAPTAKIKSGQRIFFNNDQIAIKGASTSNSAFTNWIKKLKKLSWIENLEIVDFQKNGNTNSFEIRLKLKFNV